MCLLPPSIKGLIANIEVLIVMRLKCHNSLLFEGLKIGKMSPRTKRGVVRVELPVCWKYGWVENVQRGAQNSVRIRHFRYRRRAAGV